MLKKRIISLLLVLILITCAMPLSALASENTEAQALSDKADEEAAAPEETEEDMAVSDGESVLPPAEEDGAVPVDREEEITAPEAEEAAGEGEEAEDAGAQTEDESSLLGVSPSALTEEEKVVNEATGRVQGPEGNQDVAVVVYGKTMAEALLGITGDFEDFAQALKSELQGVLANEKLPDVELYLVNSNNEEYRLTKNAASEAALISSFDIKGENLGKIIEYLADFCQWIYEMIFDGVDTIGQFYKIYGAENVPEGDYTLEIRRINGDGYTMYRPQNATAISVHVGDSNVNYVGYRQRLGTLDAEFSLGPIDIDLGNVTIYGPGIYLNTVDPGFSFTSADLGGNALPGTGFVLINRDETEKIIKAAYRLGKDTFTNAMNLVGTEGYTWKDLSLLYNHVLTWDQAGQQIALNEEQAYKLLATYWSLVKASAMDPAVAFMSDETDIRLPAILKADAGKNGRVFFGEQNNVTLVWSVEILLRLSNAVVSDISSEDINDLKLDDETAAIVRLVFSLAKYGAEKGVEFFDEDGKPIARVINDWVYPILQNENVMKMARNALAWFIDEDDFSEADRKMLKLLPTHAILTKKMPSGKYILFESSVPDSYIHTPLFYTIDLSWNTGSSRPADWCYVTVGNVGILTPYFAEEYYNYLRSYNASAEADRILNKITGNETGTLIQDIISDRTDVSALMISYYSGIIYNYMGGRYIYGSELELSADLTKYLYAHGRTAQNLLIFGDSVAKKSRSVVTDKITAGWKFYTYTTSIRTNLALRTQAILRGIADSIDTTEDNAVTSAVKETINEAADNLDTSNRISQETTAVKKEAEKTVKNAVTTMAEKAREAAKKAVKTIFGWSRKYGD